MVNHLQSPLWKLWMKHLHSGLPEERLEPQEWRDWMTKKTEEWKKMKREGKIDVKRLSIAKRGKKYAKKKILG